VTEPEPRRAQQKRRNSIVFIGLAAVLAASWQSAAQQPRLDGDPSSTVSFSTVAGDVEFEHKMHFSDFEIDCIECHHEANASALDTPHAEYLETSSIDCSGCHREGGEAIKPHACSRCHPDTPADIADESLSSKVVIHEVCWGCHEVGRGRDASESCANCHQRGPQSH
jgi:hypothetical protein